MLLVLLACADRIYPSREAILAESFARVDPDGDGRISAVEMKSLGAREFDAIPWPELDPDGDGMSVADFDTMLREREPRPLLDDKNRNHSPLPVYFARSPRPGRIP